MYAAAADICSGKKTDGATAADGRCLIGPARCLVGPLLVIFNEQTVFMHLCRMRAYLRPQFCEAIRVALALLQAISEQ